MLNFLRIFKSQLFNLSIIFCTTLLVFDCAGNNSQIKMQQSINEHFVLATLYNQVAGECKALQIQAFNIAKFQILEYLKISKLTEKSAVVLDIDETILETSSYQTMMITQNQRWPYKWNEFLGSNICNPIPGAKEFLDFVDSIGINIFYISNRPKEQYSALVNNLDKFDFPQISENHILLKDITNSKESRRELIKRDYDIILYIGDSLNDFSNLFGANSITERNNKVIENSSKFGTKFIILPNPTYGEWENLIYNNNWKSSPTEQDSMRKHLLDSLYKATFEN